jgi:LacI family transcriptional regulator
LPRERVTITEIAEAAGVSKSTVSLVLRGSALVAAKSKERVRQTIHDLGYVYNRSAANLRRSRSNIVAMVINDLTNPFYAELAVGIESVFQSAGYLPLIANTADSVIRQSDVLAGIREQGVAGLIIAAAHGSAANAIDDFTSVGIPVVQVMRRIPGARVAAVIPDNRLGARRAVDHLVGLGHRRIAFVGGFADTLVRSERLSGYHEAITTARIEYDESLVVEGLPNREGGVSAAVSLLRLPNPPTAMMCFNDVVAFGVCAGLKRQGQEPGRDIAIVGFDDIADARHATPALTTVAVNCRGLGERAAHLVLRSIESGTLSTDVDMGPIHLIVRESCGAQCERLKEAV